jgi:hypothetical protein
MMIRSGQWAPRKPLQMIGQSAANRGHQADDDMPSGRRCAMTSASASLLARAVPPIVRPCGRRVTRSAGGSTSGDDDDYLMMMRRMMMIMIVMTRRRRLTMMMMMMIIVTITKTWLIRRRNPRRLTPSLPGLITRALTAEPDSACNEFRLALPKPMTPADLMNPCIPGPITHTDVLVLHTSPVPLKSPPSFRVWSPGP